MVYNVRYTTCMKVKVIDYVFTRDYLGTSRLKGIAKTHKKKEVRFEKMSKIICSPDLTSSTVGQILCAGKKKKFKEEGLVNENRQHKDIIVSKMKKKTGSKDGFRHRLE